MNIQTIWQQEIRTDDLLDIIVKQGRFNQIQSTSPLKKLRTNLIIGIVLALLSTIAYLVLFYYVSIWQVLVAISILILFNLFIIFDSWKLYLNTPEIIQVTNSLKQELELHYQSFSKWWSLQQRISLFIYPVAVSGGFILGGASGSGKPVEEFLYNPMMLAFLGLSILVFMPVCYYSARWMFRYSYGRHLKQLKATIDELE